MVIEPDKAIGPEIQCVLPESLLHLQGSTAILASSEGDDGGKN